uniref:Uncharacterized protein n=1 Tax=Anguilla anguilla TaxID=7936 RepID=A0A0E9X2Q0_ANGAN
MFCLTPNVVLYYMEVFTLKQFGSMVFPSLHVGYTWTFSMPTSEPFVDSVCPFKLFKVLKLVGSLNILIVYIACTIRIQYI